MTLNTADAVYLGTTAADAVYLGDNLVWSQSSWDVDTQAYVAATGLPEPYVPALDGLIKGLKATGLWDKMNAAYAFIGGTQALHQWNLKDPRDLDAAYRLTYDSAAASIHSDALGYRPNVQGSVVNGAYADTHLTPFGTLDQNSTHLSLYSLADVPAIQRCDMGCFAWSDANARFHIIARYQPTMFYYGMAEGGATNVDVPASSGLFVATRTDAMTQTGYRNGVRLQSSQIPSIGLPTLPIWIGGIDSFNERSDLPFGFASIGSSLNDQNVTDLYAVVQAYQTALNRQV